MPVLHNGITGTSMGTSSSDKADVCISVSNAFLMVGPRIIVLQAWFKF